MMASLRCLLSGEQILGDLLQDKYCSMDGSLNEAPYAAPLSSELGMTCYNTSSLMVLEL